MVCPMQDVPQQPTQAPVPPRDEAPRYETPAVKKIGSRLAHVHLREYPDVEERQTYECKAEEEIPGRGGVDFPKFLKALKTAGYKGAMDLDIIGAFTYPLSRQMGIGAESRGYINRCLQELK